MTRAHHRDLHGKTATFMPRFTQIKRSRQRCQPSFHQDRDFTIRIVTIGEIFSFISTNRSRFPQKFPSNRNCGFNANPRTKKSKIFNPASLHVFSSSPSAVFKTWHGICFISERVTKDAKHQLRSWTSTLGGDHELYSSRNHER